ncbi:DUF1707 SHOCT-like domain-containing protein [Pseudonocardia nigra]|uniref:DUF1707 SHOCT-like domain-containing protein n=1 Tax=Pseudonocardia nigra TaxID=1921578 RepID=UPI001C5EF51F|nr:DUF1707 domain-containing protein [Pseudonocardia nigra]
MRASDADRERTVAILQREVGTGRLTLDEFSERSAIAYHARTLGELAALTRDLPRPIRGGQVHTRRVGVPILSTLALLAVLALAGLATSGVGDLINPVAFSCH